jgi:hypothetical protein
MIVSPMPRNYTMSYAKPRLFGCWLFLYLAMGCNGQDAQLGEAMAAHASIDGASDVACGTTVTRDGALQPCEADATANSMSDSR